MRKKIATMVVLAVFTIGFAASDETGESTTVSKSNYKEIATNRTIVDDKSVTQKTISQIKEIDELRHAINNTIWTHTTKGDVWLRYEFTGNTIKQYGAMPADGKWRYDGDSEYELSEHRSRTDGKKYIVATFYPKTESLAMFELPVVFNFRDYHLYLNGQDMGGFIMSDYEWE